MEAAERERKGKLPDFDSLWEGDRPAVTEKKLRDLLPAALDSRDLSYLTQLLTQIARAEGLQRKFQAAHETLDRVEKSLVKEDANDKTRVRYTLERARIFNSSGNRDVAKPMFQDAFDLAINIKDDSDAVDAARMLATVETEEKSLQWNLKALDLAENSKDERARTWMGSIYNNLGWTYFDQGNFEEAHLMFDKVLQIREQEGDANKILVAKWAVGKVLRMMGHAEEALEMQRDVFDQYRAMGRKNGYVYEEIAECMLTVGLEQESREWFAAAFEELSKDSRLAEEQDRLNRLKELGGLGRPATSEAQ